MHTDSVSINENLIFYSGEGFNMQIGHRAFDLTSQFKGLETCSGIKVSKMQFGKLQLCS